MDCIIPGHSVRPFCYAIGCLGRIGKDVYVEFDAIDGLALRTINDAKSSFASFRFHHSFFERCSAPPLPRTAVSTRKRSRNDHNTSPQADSNDNDTDEIPRFSCRLSLRALATVVKARKGVVSLRIQSEVSDSALALSFEFQIENQNAPLTVVHKMKAADATGVSPVAPTTLASQIRGSPRVLLKLLDPLKNTSQVALVIRGDADCVSASSFHHTDTSGHSHQSQNAVLQASSASFLKTETAVACDELDEIDFHQNRRQRQQGEGDEDDEAAVEENLPNSVNSEVILVFSMKEIKAMLQFCSQAHTDHELLVSMYFHWGGRPLVIEANSEAMSARLVMATLDHEQLQPTRREPSEN